MRKARAMADALLRPRPREMKDIFVQKTARGYDCYAYDAKGLKERLECEGLAGQPVWFLQQWRALAPFALGDGYRAVEAAGVVVEMPGEAAALDAAALSRLPEPLMQGGEKATGEGSRFWRIAAVLAAVTALADLGMRWQTHRALETELAALRTDRSFYEIRALSDRYEKAMREEKALYRAVAAALQRPFERLECTPKGCR